MHVMQLWFLGYMDWSFKSFSLIKSWVQNWVFTPWFARFLVSKKKKLSFFILYFQNWKNISINFFFFFEKTQFSVWYVLISYESQSFKIITKMSLKIFIISFLQYFNKFTKNLVAYLLDTSIFNRDIHDSYISPNYWCKKKMNNFPCKKL